MQRDNMFAVGFTGTQNGLVLLQRLALRELLKTLYQHNARLFLHGDCVGADEQAHHEALHQRFEVDVYPPLKEEKRAFVRGYRKSYPPKDYMKRNDDIIHDCRILVACPRGFEEELRSGTWATVRRSRKADKPIRYVWPDGLITRNLRNA